MGKNFKEMWTDIKGEIKEISPEELSKRITNGKKTILLDVREKDEVRKEYICGAELLPRGFLEMRVEELIPDKEKPIVVYLWDIMMLPLYGAGLSSGKNRGWRS